MIQANYIQDNQEEVLKRLGVVSDEEDDEDPEKKESPNQ